MFFSCEVGDILSPEGAAPIFARIWKRILRRLVHNSNMSRKYRIRLGYLEVMHADGEINRIGWTDLVAYQNGELSPSATARRVYPRLPRRISQFNNLPAGLIRRLQIRVFLRQLREGTLNEFWIPPSHWPLVFLGISAAFGASAALVFRLCSWMNRESAWWPAMNANLPPHHWWLMGFLLTCVGVAITLYTLGPLIIFGPYLRSRLAHPKTLAWRVTARGLEALRNNGTSILYEWNWLQNIGEKGLLVFQGNSPQMVALAPLDRSTWQPVLEAVRRHFRIQSTIFDFRHRIRRSVFFGLFFGALAELLRYFAQKDTDVTMPFPGIAFLLIGGLTTFTLVLAALETREKKYRHRHRRRVRNTMCEIKDRQKYS